MQQPVKIKSLAIRQPLADWVILEHVEMPEQKTGGGIIIARPGKPGEREDPSAIKIGLGRVLHAGDGRWNRDGSKNPLRVQPGDHVIYNMLLSEPIILNGRPLVMVQEATIVSTVEVEVEG